MTFKFTNNDICEQLILFIQKRLAIVNPDLVNEEEQELTPRRALLRQKLDYMTATCTITVLFYLKKKHTHIFSAIKYDFCNKD